MFGLRISLMITTIGSLIVSVVQPTLGQTPASKPPSPLERFLALPPDRQETLRNELQPLFFRSMQSNGRLTRMAQECNLPLPPEATPAERLEADLQSPESAMGKMFGPARQGALLARLRGALQTSIDCKLAPDLRPDMIKQLREFPHEFETKLEAGLSGPGVNAAPGGQPAWPTAQAAPRLMIGAPGHCELMTGGQSQPCVSGLLYVQMRDGPALVSVKSSPTVTIGFQGDGDGPLSPEHNTLRLARMHTSVDGQQVSKTVTGTCEISMTADGTEWKQASCRARDGNGLETVMTFKGDGRPVSSVHPGADAPKAPAPG